MSIATARRAVLGAQGFASPRPTGRVDRGHVRRLFARLGLVQIDSVNVLVRAHELPLFTRLGPHPRDVLQRMCADGELFEYWGHEASFVPTTTYPLLRWRMEGAYNGEAKNDLVRFQQARPDFVESVYEMVATRGPVTASELEGKRTKRGTWWDWHDSKFALEFLFYAGRITARRGPNFERTYDLPERVLPAAVLAQPVPDEGDAKRALLRIAARALGVATVADLCDYWRLNVPHSRPLVAELVEEGELVAVKVEGWRDVAYVVPELRVPRRVRAAALVSPFDPLVWERKRLHRLFDFEYRIEIYTPAPKRVFGYYVLPFVFGDRLVARVDVRAERRGAQLLVPGAFAEPHIPDDAVPALAAELLALARWLGLDAVVVGDRGDLAERLRSAVHAAQQGALGT